MADRLVGVREAGPRLNVHPKTLALMCREGRSPIPARRTTSGWVFRDSDIDRHIADLFGDSEPAATASAG